MLNACNIITILSEKKMKKLKLLAILLVLLVSVALFVSCGGECAHEFDEGTCKLCGASDPNYTAPCEHAYEDGICTECGAADPDYTPVCAHEFVNGGCTKCNKACVCVFANGSCVFCNKSCTCNFENGVCTVCGKACECSFENGACTVCAKPCTCAFLNGNCIVCGKACNCIYENGACKLCGKACDCDFEAGACKVCGKACECSFENGVCTVCGANDSSFDGKELYAEMIAKFKYLMAYMKSNQELPEKEENPTIPNYDALYSVVGNYDPSNDIGYSYKDIDGDGLLELLLIGPDSRLYAIFTLVDKTPVTVETFQNGLGYLHNSTNVFYWVKILDDSGVQIKSEFHYTRLVGDKLVGFAYGREDHDQDHDELTEDIYYYIPEGGERIDFVSDGDGDAYDKYKVYSNYIYEYFNGYQTRLSKQSNLVFNSAFDVISEATIVADFSTYDAIIKTFGLMHSSVAGGKYERSSFTSGKYNDKMIFNSDEDFIVYNRLIAACVLSQNSTTATFGYAKKDLNGDGTAELILLEGNKRYILAIFTEVDGKPVLLDTYNDLRAAFIDTDGLIHVFERIIPGSKKDFEYYVYTIEAGKLVAKEIFGVKCDVKGNTQVAWYKVVDGNTVDIEKTDYESLLEKYFLIVGTVNASNCAKYNLEKSGLEFILATADVEE